MKIRIQPRFMFGQLLAIVATCLASQNLHAQLLFSEAFNYTTGVGLATQVNPGNSTAWVNGNNTELQIGNQNLSFNGLQDQGGNNLVYTSSGSASSTYNTYTPVTSGNIYYSFLIDCTLLPTANQEIMALNPGTTTPGGSGDAMGTYVGATTGGWKIGVRTTGGGSGAAYSPAVLLANQTYFVVEELALGSTSVASIWVNAVPGSSQGTADITQSTTTAIASVADIGIKVQSATTTGNFLIDNLLIGQTWADVTPAAVPEPSTLALAGLGGICLLGLATRVRRARG